MFEFAWWWALLALPLPLFALALKPIKRARQAPLRVSKVMGELPASQQPVAKRPVRLVLMTLAWISLVLAAARPQWLGEPVSIPSEGRDLMIAVDLSGSMKMDDMSISGRQVDRLTMIKYVLSDFIERRVGDRLGLILFADTAYLQAPLTYDRETVKTLLGESVIGLVGEQTAIGDAIGLAVKRFEQKTSSNKVLILLTDGQNTAGNITPAQAKTLAINSGVTIYTIGVGADKMLRRGLFGTSQINPSAELDEDTLTDIARTTGGQYFRARDAESLQAIYAQLDRLEPIERETRQMRPLTALFYYPLAIALGLSLILALLPLAATYNPFSSRSAIND